MSRRTWRIPIGNSKQLYGGVMICLRGQGHDGDSIAFEPAELEARYETAADPASKSHFHAIWLLSLNYKTGEVAEYFLVFGALGPTPRQALQQAWTGRSRRPAAGQRDGSCDPHARGAGGPERTAQDAAR